jgi:calcineurin-like phosphoesterase family protein
VSNNEQYRCENEQLRSGLDQLKIDVKDYPQRVIRLEAMELSLNNRIETNEGISSHLCDEIKKQEGLIAALESENVQLDLRAGLPRRCIELTSQDVSEGEIHLYIKVPQQPKEALKYADREDIRHIKKTDYAPDSVESLATWLIEGNVHWAFSKSSQGDIRYIKKEDIPTDHDVFFIGDIHGDFKSLSKIVDYIDQVDPYAILVFMGDIFDRGDQEMDAVCLLLTLIKARPGRILWIVGNHDAALKYQNDKFISTVSPATLFDTLNQRPEYREFGCELIRIIEKLPVAAIFPDGLWVSHGAVPHSDVQNDIADLSKLPSLARADCVNARLVDQQKKIPNRGSSTHDVGFENVIGFVDIIRKLTGIEIRQLLCGHQHTVTDGAGILQYRKCFKDLLCHGLYTSSESSAGSGCVSPCIAKYRPDMAPVIIIPST